MATAAPSYSTCWTILKETIELYYDTWSTLVGSGGWAELQDTAIQNLAKGQLSSQAVGVVDGHRQQLSSIVAGARSAMIPALREMGRAISSNSTDIQTIISDLFRYMDDNSDTVNSRNPTRGSFSQTVGSSTGKGGVYRLTKDADNYDIETGVATTIRLTCVQDQNTGADEGGAIFQVRTTGTVPFDELFQRTAGAKIFTIPARSADDSVSGLKNPHFSTYNSSGGTEKFTGWTLSSASNATEDTSNIYRADRRGTSRALKITGTVTCTQTIDQRVRLKRNVPYGLRVAWNREVGSGAGTLLIRFGSKSTSVVASAQTGWQILNLIVDDPDGCWPENATEDELDISVEWTHTSGYVLVDELFFGPMDGPVNGTWIHIATGATEWVIKDELKATDSFGETAIIQEMFDRAFGRYLPSVHGGTETITDP